MAEVDSFPLPAGVTKKRSALVVEDNREFSELITEFLKQLGFDVKQCYDGLQASVLVRDEHYDLIILDLRIPSVNGLQVGAVARANAANRTSNIFIITGEADETLRTKATALRIRNFLLKPVNFVELDKAIREQFSVQEKKVSYDIRIINAFIDAAAEVYEFYFTEKPQRGKVQVRKPGLPEKGFCTGLIALSGEAFVGSLGVSMTAPFIKRFATTLFQGMEIKFDNDFISDITGELCNQILGKVKLNMAKLGIKILIGLPEVIMGKNHIIQHKVSNPVIALAMGRDNMVFELQFVLSQQEVKFEEVKQEDVPVSSVIMFE
jgi:chemotaxis protein CheX